MGDDGGVRERDPIQQYITSARMIYRLFFPLIGVKKSLVYRFVAEARFSVLRVAAACGGGGGRSLAAGDYM